MSSAAGKSPAVNPVLADVHVPFYPCAMKRKQTLFLKECLRYIDPTERQKLEESISQLQRDEHCVRRALSWTLMQAALAFAGLGYCAVFLDDSHDLLGLTSHFIFRMLCVLVVVPVICVPVFLGVAYCNRRKLDRHGE